MTEECSICKTNKVLNKLCCCRNKICFNCIKNSIVCPYCRHLNLENTGKIYDSYLKTVNATNIVKKMYFEYKLRKLIYEVYFDI